MEKRLPTGNTGISVCVRFAAVAVLLMSWTAAFGETEGRNPKKAAPKTDSKAVTKAATNAGVKTAAKVKEAAKALAPAKAAALPVIAAKALGKIVAKTGSKIVAKVPGVSGKTTAKAPAKTPAACVCVHDNPAKTTIATSNLGTKPVPNKPSVKPNASIKPVLAPLPSMPIPERAALGINRKDRSSAGIANRFLLDKPFRAFTGEDKRQVRRELEALLHQNATQQFLRVIQLAEGGEPNIMVGDKEGCRVQTLKQHPGDVLPRRCFFKLPDGRFSTASGNYQITRDNFHRMAPFLGINDFEVWNQQLLALELIRRGGRMPRKVRKGFEALVRGNFRSALKDATGDWASMPGTDLYGKQRSSREVEGYISDVSKKNFITNDGRPRLYNSRPNERSGRAVRE